MTHKRVSQRSHPTPLAVVIQSNVLTEQAVAEVLESSAAEPTAVPRVSPELRRQMVAAAAYFMAERRGFAAGHEFDDWIAAEAQVDAQFRPVIAA